MNIVTDHVLIDLHMHSFQLVGCFVKVLLSACIVLQA